MFSSQDVSRMWPQVMVVSMLIVEAILTQVPAEWQKYSEFRCFGRLISFVRFLIRQLADVCCW